MVGLNLHGFVKKMYFRSFLSVNENQISAVDFKKRITVKQKVMKWKIIKSKKLRIYFVYT